MNPAPAPELVRAAAEVAGVCARPVISTVTDLETGETLVVPTACRHTRGDRCKPCAERAKRLRMQQCRQGWHLDTEPEWTDPDDDRDPHLRHIANAMAAPGQHPGVDAPHRPRGHPGGDDLPARQRRP